MTDELQNVMMGRAAVYEYLSILFRCPPKKSFIGLSSAFAPPLKAVGKESDNQDIYNGAVMLEEYGDFEKTALPAILLDSLNMAYTSLFNIGGFSVPGTESVYLSHDAAIKQEPWEEVLTEYRRRKFTPPEDLKEPEDHISAELAFMQAMSIACAGVTDYERMERMLKEQAVFLDAHLLRWASNFAGAVYSRPEDDSAYRLYKAGALLLKGYLVFDREVLDNFIN